MTLRAQQSTEDRRTGRQFTTPKQPLVQKADDDKGKYDPSVSADKYTESFIQFMYDNPTTYHAVAGLAKELEDNGFSYISERDCWDDAFKNGKQKFYTTRNGSSLIAFVIGKNWKPGHGAAIIGAHIDALTIKLKPVSAKETQDGYTMIGVAPYSGALSDVWWDRDLGVAGRIIVKGDKKVERKLAHLDHPIGVVPTLAPHFGAAADGPFNKETQMVPIIGQGEEPEPTEEEKQSPVYGKHSLKLLRALSKSVNVPVKDFIQVELEMFNTEKGNVAGLDGEFLRCPRIDDKICSYSAINALIESLDSTIKGSSLNVVACYDNEEIGSLLRQGAQGNLLEGSIDRILTQYGSDDELKRLTYANSFFLSSDVSHAHNPNFPNTMMDHHKPTLNRGLVMSFDPNGHMTTDAVSAAVAEEVARKCGDKLQYFQIRNDSRSGGTIGPFISSKNGVRAIDIGIPQLSMHSVRATTGSKDIWLGVRYFKNFFENWEEVDAQFKLGDL